MSKYPTSNWRLFPPLSTEYAPHGLSQHSHDQDSSSLGRRSRCILWWWKAGTSRTLQLFRTRILQIVSHLSLWQAIKAASHASWKLSTKASGITSASSGGMAMGLENKRRLQTELAPSRPLTHRASSSKLWMGRCKRSVWSLWEYIARVLSKTLVKCQHGFYQTCAKQAVQTMHNPLLVDKIKRITRFKTPPVPGCTLCVHLKLVLTRAWHSWKSTSRQHLLNWHR